MVKPTLILSLAQVVLAASLSGRAEQIAIGLESLSAVVPLESRCRQFKSYTALGDSIASGFGAGSRLPLCNQTQSQGTADCTTKQCGKYYGSYAYRFAKDFGVQNFQYLACAGTITEDVIAHQVNSPDFGEPDLVTVSAGADDGDLFHNVALACLKVGGIQDSCRKAVDDAKREIKNIGGRMQRLVSTIRNKRPTATIVIVSYFRFFPKDNRCATCTIFSNEAMDRMNDVSNELNNALQIKTDPPVVFAHPDDLFTGHRFCSSCRLWPLPPQFPEAWFNFPYPNAPGGDADDIRMHPNTNGQDAIYRAVQSALGC